MYNFGLLVSGMMLKSKMAGVLKQALLKGFIFRKGLTIIIFEFINSLI